MKKFRRIFLWGLLLAVSGALIFKFYFAQDRKYFEVESFVRGEIEVQKQLGDVKTVQLRNYRSVGASDTAGPYQKYILVVSGAKATGVVTVVVTPRGGIRDQYVITEIDR